MGISATRTIMLSYGLSGLVAAMAGILVSRSPPLAHHGVGTDSEGLLRGGRGGLDSGFGVVVIGLILAPRKPHSFYLGSGWREAQA